MSSSATPLLETTRDGASIAVHEVSRVGTFDQAVLTTHGTFSDAGICRRLARSFARAGFASYVLEWRGHGDSPRESTRARGTSLETIALYDVPAALDLVRRRSGKQRVLWVGHSGGGFLPMMLIAREPCVGERFDGIVGLATQTSYAGASIRSRVQIGAAAALTNVLGRAPGRALKLGPQDETPSVMNQWYRWNWTGNWIGRDGFDYERASRDLNVAVLLLAAHGDEFIAPPRACRAFFDSLGSADKTFIECGRATGFREDYTHSRIIASRSATQEVWPLVTDWLRARATVLSIERPGRDPIAV